MILPVELRQALGVGKGDRVMLQRVGERIEMTTAQLLRAQARARVQARCAGAKNVVDEFLAERRAEAQQENTRMDAGQEASGPNR